MNGLHQPLIRRRSTHIGVLSEGMWVAHDRRVVGDNGVPTPNP